MDNNDSTQTGKWNDDWKVDAERNPPSEDVFRPRSAKNWLGSIFTKTDGNLSRSKATLLTVALAGGLGVGGALAANAASTTTTPSAAATAPAGLGFGDGGPHGGRGGFMGGLGGDAIHGSDVVESSTGTYSTVVFQDGTVTAVSPTSISIKSADGYTQTYAVSSTTVVTAESSGISSISTGDTVRIVDTTTGSTTTSQITDQTLLKSVMPSAPTSPSSTSSSTTA